MPLIELFDGFYVNVGEGAVAVVKATGEEESALFTCGQSAVDGGFHVPYSAKEVAEQYNEAEDEYYEEVDDEEA